MPKFRYSLADGSYRFLSAASKTAAEELLRQKRVRYTGLEAVSGNFNLPWSRGLPVTAFSRFTRQFATMYGAGLPLAEALEILSGDHDYPKFQEAIRQVLASVKSGLPLANALRTQPRYFNELYCQLVAAGEASHTLDVILKRLADHLEKTAKIRRKIQSALLYPALLLSVSIIIVFILCTYVIPTFADMFQELGRPLPFPTIVTITISQALGRHFLLIAAFVFAAGWGINRYRKTKAGRRFLQNLLIKIPVLGGLWRKSLAGRFSRDLGTLLGSGVSILEALKISRATVGSLAIEEKLEGTIREVAQGKSLASSLEGGNLFPRALLRMIEVGERTGEVGPMLVKSAELYEDEVDVQVDALTALLEPVLLVIMGAVIGAMVFSLYMPLFDVITIVQ